MDRGPERRFLAYAREQEGELEAGYLQQWQKGSLYFCMILFAL